MGTPFNPELDLRQDCETRLNPEQLWAGWTQPELYPEWFCPRPWVCTEAHIDLRPGGAFATTMQGPEGQRMVNAPGCFLLVEAPKRLVWTNILGPDFMPAEPSAQGFGFVVDLRFDALPTGGSRYQALVRHAKAQDKQVHADMGFEAGWRAALAQLEDLLVPHSRV